MLWLGGDVAFRSSLDDSVMSRIDSILDVSNPNTLWALGNHDYDDLGRIQNFTNRSAFYSYHRKGITYIILDTQDSLSNIIGNQKAFFNRVLDTLQNSTHLVILHHKLIWMYNNSTLQPQIPAIANGGLGTCFYCINPNNFYVDIYPRLIEAKNKGIEVICIAGDIGKFANEFQHITSEGIHLLASGISYNTSVNKALLFTHDLKNEILTWEYKLITDL